MLWRDLKRKLKSKSIGTAVSIRINANFVCHVPIDKNVVLDAFTSFPLEDDDQVDVVKIGKNVISVGGG
jgi:hypothetical protein